MALSDLLLYPLTLVLLHQLLLVLLLGFTSGYSPLRLLLGLPVVFCLNMYIVDTCFERTGLTVLGGMFGTTSTCFMLQYIDAALIGRWDIGTNGPQRVIGQISVREPNVNQNASTGDQLKVREKVHVTAKLRRQRFTVRDRLRFGWRAATDNRGSNTAWESRNVPHFSRTNPAYVPSRGRFLTTNVATVAICYIVLDVLTATPPDNAKQMYSLDKLGLFNRLAEVTGEEMSVRFITTAALWVSVISSNAIFYGCMAVLMVGLGIDEPKDWRPLFGQVSDAYTVRRFWSPFWHQLHRRRFSAIATVIAYDTLRLPRSFLLTKYIFQFIVFFLSGLLHLASSVAEGMPWEESGAVTFFLAQFAALACEDFIGWATGLSKRAPSRWMKAFGYIWVISFMTVMSPYWVYPALVRAPGGTNDTIVPYSFVRALTSK